MEDSMLRRSGVVHRRRSDRRKLREQAIYRVRGRVRGDAAAEAAKTAVQLGRLRPDLGHRVTG